MINIFKQVNVVIKFKEQMAIRTVHSGTDSSFRKKHMCLKQRLVFSVLHSDSVYIIDINLK